MADEDRQKPHGARSLPDGGDISDSLLGDLARAPSVSAGATSMAPAQEASRSGRSGSELLPGDRLAERFEVIQLIGRGGFGTVHLARDLELGRHVAIKILGSSRVRPPSEDELLLFDREAKATARLNHPNIVTIHDWGIWRGRPYLVLERLKGESLADRLERGPLPAAEAVQMAIGLARGLAHAHCAGVLHLDLKPQNIYCCSDGLIKLLDLGLAQLDPGQESLGSALQQSEGQLAQVLESPITGGTPAYMAPEQWRGEPADERTDYWAMGVVLFEALSGELPFRVTRSGSGAVGHEPAPSVRDRAAGAPKQLGDIVSRALAKDRSERYQSSEQLLDDLLAVERLFLGGPGETDQPYRYLEAFTEADAPWFCGRDREIARLRTILESRPLVALIGASGAGKSSLVQAGLIPRLRRGERAWTILSMRPGNDPVRVLSELLEELTGEEANLKARPGALGRHLREFARRTEQHILLFVDQFEELFTHGAGPEVRQAFSAALLSAADHATAPVRVVIGLRGDFLSRLAEHPPLRDQVSSNNLILGPPDAQGMAEAIVGPAQRQGYEMEAGLAEQMVENLRHEAAPLPLLQLAASRLWDERDRDRRLVTSAVLSRLGGVGGVLAAHADGVLDQLSDEADVRVAREIFLRLSTTEGTRRPMERVTLLAAFSDSDDAARVLELLLRGRLVTSSKREGKVWIELAHEALLGRWERLRRWIGQEGDQRRFHERVVQAAALWEERGRPRHLLWTAEAHQDALQWRREFSGALTPIERDFLAAGEARATRRQRMRRVAVASALVVAVAGVAGSIFWMRAYRRAAHAAWVSGILRTAGETRDRLLGALLLAQLENEPEPPGGLQVARRIARQPIPQSEVLGVGAVSPDGKKILVARGEEVFVYRLDGRGRPVVIRTGRGTIDDRMFSPDGSRFVRSTADGRVRIWPSDGTGPVIELPTHEGPASALFGPKGSLLTADRGWRRIRLWSTDGARQLRVIATPGWMDTPRAAGFSRDGRLLYLNSADGVRVWRLDAPGTEVRFLRTPRPLDTVFSPDGTRAFVGTLDGVRIWRLPWEGSKGRPPVPGSIGAPWPRTGHPVAVSSDGKLVLTARAGSVQIFRVDGSVPPIRLRTRDFEGWRFGSFSPDGKLALVDYARDSAALVRTDGKGAPTILQGGGGRRARFVPDGSRVITFGRRSVRIWPVRGKGEPVILRRHLFVGSVWFSPDGTRVATFELSRVHRTVLVFPLDRPRAPAVLRHPASVSFGIASPFHPDGTRIVTGAADGIVRVWQLPRAGATTVAAPRELRGHRAPIVSVSFSPSGREVLSTSRDGTLRIWPLESGARPVVLRTPKGWVAARFSPDSRRIAALCGKDGSVRVFRAEGSSETRTLGRHRPATPGDFWSGLLRWPPRFSPDGTKVVTASMDRTARVWSLDGSAPPVVLRGHDQFVNSASFSPDGRKVITGARDWTARIWNADGRGKPRVLRGHGNQVVWAGFSPDGSRVLTASYDGTARLWASDGKGEPEALVAGSNVLHASFSPDGGRIATAGAGGQVHVFRVGWKNLLAYLRSVTRVCLTPKQRTKYLAEGGEEARVKFEACERRYVRLGVQSSRSH